MTIDWMHAWPTALAAFLGSAVEFVEALTVVLAVGTVRGWRSALTGTLRPSPCCWRSSCSSAPC